MSTNSKNKDDDLREFISSLKLSVREWLALSKTNQRGLAKKMRLTPTAVSNNLHPDFPMSEGFVERLSQNVAPFSNALTEYYAIKSGLPLAQDARDSADAKKAQAERIQRLRSIEEEAVKSIRETIGKVIEDIESTE